MPQKPSESEEEYFARREFEKRKELAEKRSSALDAEKRARLKEMHYMHCPKDGNELVTVVLKGVQVDSCAQCSGIWLDAGELDGLLANDEGGLLRKFRSVFGGE